jgi:LysM repeat protein
MKWLFLLLLAVVIFGGAAFFSYDLFVKPERKIQQEKSGEIPVEPVPDVSLPDFQAAAKLRQEGKLAETRDALLSYLQKFPTGLHIEEAKDLLGQVNVEMLFTEYRSPDKQEYIVRSGDVLAKIAHKTKTTPELIMRTNNLTNPMLRVGQRLLISHPDFSIFIQRKAQTVILLNHGQFFKRYRVKQVKLSPKQAPRITTRVAEVMAWRGGRRVGFGTKEWQGSVRWIRLAQPGYFLFAVPEPGQRDESGQPPPPGLGLPPSDMEELSSLVNSKTAVTITD